MATKTINQGGSDTSGALAADTVFWVQSGVVLLSTDGGTTKIPFYGPVSESDRGDKVVFSSGLTVQMFNERRKAATVLYMEI